MRWFLKLFGFIPESPIASSNGGPDAEREYGRVCMAAAEARARAKRARDRRDTRGYGEACAQAEILTRTLMMIEAGR